jgi:V/A-type H+-transporting ATPase subunit I
MPWRDAMTVVDMSRVAIVAPRWVMRQALVTVAAAGTVELDRLVSPADLPVSEATRRLQHALTTAGGPVDPALTLAAHSLETLERAGRVDLLAGEAELAERCADAVARDDVMAWIGWTPSAELEALDKRLAEIGAAAVALERPSGVLPPTATRQDGAAKAFAPLVRTYTTVAYPDLDPTLLAGLAYVVMFGAMFGDVGHGFLLAVGGLLARRGRPRWLRKLSPYWLFITSAGIASMAFGWAYGECFGPTGLVPVGWVAPMDDPVRLLLAGVGLGAVLLAGAYVLGTINRVREGGWVYALYAPSGFAGVAVFAAAGMGAAAWYFGLPAFGLVAVVLGGAGLVLAFVGLLRAAGGGAAGVLQAGIELMDLVIRLGANVVSFARLAAFGLTHAVLGWVVWQATTALWGNGWIAAAAAVVVFVLGNAIAFGLEALVAGVQALRLEYYELFSRVFQIEGRPFKPWRVATVAAQID